MNTPTTDAALPPASVTPVRIDARLIGRIGVREWGLPSMCVPGKIWRSEDHETISCMTAKGEDLVNIETLPLEIVEPGSEQWMPDAWRAALWEYVQAWPSSGCGYGPFLALTEAQRCDFIRAMAKDLVASDNIGCCHIAHDIGQFAAIDYPHVDPESDQMKAAGISTEVATTDSYYEKLLVIVDDTYGTICDLLQAIQHRAAEGYCIGIGQHVALNRIAARLRDIGVEHEVLTLLEILSGVSLDQFERQGSALLFGIFCIGMREGWLSPLEL
jgi:hypothetical protein